MTTTRKLRKCIECGAPANSPTGDLCNPCYEYAGWENTHTDEGHEEPRMHFDTSNDIRDDCPVCHPELDPRVKSTRRSNANAAGKHFDHSQCAHEATKSARAKCRKQMRDSKPDVAPPCPVCGAAGTSPCTTKSGKNAKQWHTVRTV